MRVRYTPRAFRELQEIFDYIDARSPLGGRNVKDRAHAVIELIADHPHSGRRIGKRDLRRIAVFPYPYLEPVVAPEDLAVGAPSPNSAAKTRREKFARSLP